jgi:hypothetical protein
MALFIGLLVAVGGCVPPQLAYRTGGTAGPLQWQAIDLERSRRRVNGQEMDAYDFTLVVRETRGVGITFTSVTSDIYGQGREGHGQHSDRLELPAHCELQLPLSSTGFRAPLWTITLTGNDERSQPVQIAIEAALPSEPSRPELSRETANPQGPPPASAGNTSRTVPSTHSLATLSIAERRRLQVAHAAVKPDEIAAFFASDESRKVAYLSGPTVIFDPRIPLAMRRPLRSVAGAFVPGALRMNSTLVVPLDFLSAAEIGPAVRLSYITGEQRAGSCTQQILIEPASSAAEAAENIRTPLDPTVLTRHGFRLSSGWSDSEKNALAALLSRIPDRWLGKIEGLTFNRSRAHSTNPEYGGEYASDTHMITMFDEAFKPFATRFGAADRTAASIAHELGHALDFTPLRETAERYRVAQADLERAFERYKMSSGSNQYWIPPAQEKAWQEHNKKVSALGRSMEEVRSLSSSRWELQAGTRRFELVESDGDAAASEFRAAAAMDGPVRITEYAGKNWSEYFAESFSLYVTDPQALEWLRPEIYRYFTLQLPR